MLNLLRPPFLPPVWLVFAVLVMILLHEAMPLVALIPPPFVSIGWVFIGLGIAVAIYTDLVFQRRGTTILPFRQSSALVTDGLFAYSRNPIYCGMVAALLGLALLLGSASPFLVIPGFVWVIQRYFISHEEAALEVVFGDAYRAYKTRVRRWL